MYMIVFQLLTTDGNMDLLSRTLTRIAKIAYTKNKKLIVSLSVVYKNVLHQLFLPQDSSIYLTH